MVVDNQFWAGKRVLVTGHSGFKGGWLSFWLNVLGADVFGYSLPNHDEHSIYKALKLNECLAGEELADLRQRSSLEKFVRKCEPHIVFHLAAQPLVSESFDDPLSTIQINVDGVANLFEAIRPVPCLESVIIVTSDKCYQNDGNFVSLRECDPLGGEDIYSASKACAEIISSAYYNSFFRDLGVNVSSVRAGNVLGGGDWAKNRLLPEIAMSLYESRSIEIRNPLSIRPWQHVLEPVSGYMLLAQKMSQGGDFLSGPWNFGPFADQAKTVSWILDFCQKINPKFEYTLAASPGFKEMQTLIVDSTKAIHFLNWAPKLDLAKSLKMTLSWYENYYSGKNMIEFSKNQITDYMNAGKMPIVRGF